MNDGKDGLVNMIIPRFSDEEYARRYKVIREGMRQHGIDCLLVPPSENTTYLTNIHMVIFGVYVLFPETGAPTVFKVTVLPPVLGPVISITKVSRSISTSTGTTVSRSS